MNIEINDYTVKMSFSEIRALMTLLADVLEEKKPLASDAEHLLAQMCPDRMGSYDFVLRARTLTHAQEFASAEF
jgi:hypothetical protein